MKLSYLKLSKKVNIVNQCMQSTKGLKNLIDELQAKNQELQSELGKMERNANTENVSLPQIKNYPNDFRMTKDDLDGIEQIKKKYPRLSENQIERIEIERSIARRLMARNSGCFYVSQVLKTLEKLYSIKSNNRVMLLTEIKSWIERDPLCRVVKTIDNVQHYTFI